MHRLLVLALIACLPSVLPAAEWPGLKYAQVRAYFYNTDSEHDRRLLKDGKLDASVTNPAGRTLTATETKRLLALINRGAPPHPLTPCYVPHHGFVFYNGWGRPVAVFEFCLQCFKATPSPNTAGPYYDYPALADFLVQLGLPIGPKFATAQAYRRFCEKAKQAGR